MKALEGRRWCDEGTGRWRSQNRRGSHGNGGGGAAEGRGGRKREDGRQRGRTGKSGLAFTRSRRRRTDWIPDQWAKAMCCCHYW